MNASELELTLRTKIRKHVYYDISVDQDIIALTYIPLPERGEIIVMHEAIRPIIFILIDEIRDHDVSIMSYVTLNLSL